MSISEEQMQEMLKSMGGAGDAAAGGDANPNAVADTASNDDEDWDDGIGEITVQNATAATKLSYLLYYGGKGDNTQKTKTGRKAMELLLGIAETQNSRRVNADKVNGVMREVLSELLEEEYPPEVQKEVMDMLKDPENIKALNAYKNLGSEDLEQIAKITKDFGESMAENRGEALQSFLDDMAKARAARSENADRENGWLKRALHGQLMDGRVDNAGTLRASLKAHLDRLDEDFAKEQLREGTESIGHTIVGSSSIAIALATPPPINLVAYAITAMSLLNQSPDMNSDAYEKGCFVVGMLLGKTTDKFREISKNVADASLKAQKENDKTKITEKIEAHEKAVDETWEKRGTPKMLEELKKSGLLKLAGGDRMSDKALAAMERGFAESFHSKVDLSEASKILQKRNKAPKTEARSDIMRVLGRAKPESKEKDDKSKDDKPKAPETPEKSHADKEKDKKEPKKTSGPVLG